jgi:hypothetical protein
MRSLFSRKNSVALGQQAGSAGAFLWSGFSASTSGEGAAYNAAYNAGGAGSSGPLSLGMTLAKSIEERLVRLSLLIVVLLGLITFGCGPPV